MGRCQGLFDNVSGVVWINQSYVRELIERPMKNLVNSSATYPEYAIFLKGFDMKDRLDSTGNIIFARFLCVNIPYVNIIST